MSRAHPHQRHLRLLIHQFDKQDEMTRIDFTCKCFPFNSRCSGYAIKIVNKNVGWLKTKQEQRQIIKMHLSTNTTIYSWMDRGSTQGFKYQQISRMGSNFTAMLGRLILKCFAVFWRDCYEVFIKIFAC